jgi:hypothetical protein
MRLDDFRAHGASALRKVACSAIRGGRAFHGQQYLKTQAEMAGVRDARGR